MIFRPNDEFKSKFDILIMVLACYNSFSIPFRAAFEPDIMKGIYFIILDILIDLTFLADIFINFRTAFINPKGIVVETPKEMAINYIKGSFLLDLFATIPFDTIADLIFKQKNKFYELFGILKMGRVLRINKIIQFLSVNEDVKASIKLIKVIFFLVIYVHCFSCLWWYMTKKE